MTNVTIPSGTVVVRPGSRVEVHGPGGGVWCGMKLQDYIPPSEAAVSLWIDAAAQGDTTRAPASSGLSLTSRRGGGSSGSFAAVASSYGITRQAGRNVPSFGPTSTGLSGTWGPGSATKCCCWACGAVLSVDTGPCVSICGRIAW